MSFQRVMLLALLGLSFAGVRPVFANPVNTSSAEGLVILFQKQKDPVAMKAEGDRMAEVLSAKLGMPVQARIPSDYAASVQGIVSGTADAAYVDSMSAILAERDGQASILLAEERPDSSGTARTDYDSVFVARAESSVASFSDIKANAKSLTMIFTSPTSTSGYIFPVKRLVDEGVLAAKGDPKTVFGKVAFAGSYGQALEQVANGLGDIAAVSNYAIEGKSRHVSDEVAAKLKIVARTPGVPTHVVIIRKGLRAEARDALKKALLSIAQTDPKLLSDIYGAAAFREVDPMVHVRASRDALALTNIPNPAGAKK